MGLLQGVSPTAVTAGLIVATPCNIPRQAFRRDQARPAEMPCAAASVIEAHRRQRRLELPGLTIGRRSRDNGADVVPLCPTSGLTACTSRVLCLLTNFRMTESNAVVDDVR